MIYLRPLSVLCFSCFLVLTPGGAFAESCKVSRTEKKDGYIVFDQTKLSEQGKARLVNHAVSVVSAIMSTVKMVKPRCALPTYVPSYYLYNGANLVDGVANLASLVKHKEESRQELVAYVGEDGKISNQIVAFDKAYAHQMKAYQAAKRRERILKATGMARKGAVAAAGVEWVITEISQQPLKFICFNTPEAAAAAKIAGEKAAEAAAAAGTAVEAAAGLYTAATVSFNGRLQQQCKWRQQRPQTAVAKGSNGCGKYKQLRLQRRHKQNSVLMIKIPKLNTLLSGETFQG